MTLLGRAPVLSLLSSLLDAGTAVLLYGPVGAGKTELIRALHQRAVARRVPCATSPRTESLGDLTRALARAYPSVSRAGPMRQVRARLRNATDERPCVLLLDHLGRTGTAFKGALKSMRGTGAGVLLAADTEHARDHARFRELHLVQHEIPIPCLHGSTIRVLLETLLTRAQLPFPLSQPDLRALAAAAEGLPGRAVRFMKALEAASAWRNGSPRCDWLRMEAIVAAAEHYRRAV
jgi:ATPase family associated with various cellular activities (AAA)